MPSGYNPRTETERALQDSLRNMELQCKERVDLLEALKKSRLEALKEAEGSNDGPSKSKESMLTKPKPAETPTSSSKSWLGGDTIPPTTFEDLLRPNASSPAPSLPARPAKQTRPSYLSKKSSGQDVPRSYSLQTSVSPNLIPPIGEQPRRGSRTPSPEKKGGMLRTLRNNGKERTSSGKLAGTTFRNKPPTAASKAATQVWPSGQQRPSVGSVEQANGALSGSSNVPETHWDPYTRRLVERPRTHDSMNQLDRRHSDVPSTPIVRPPSPSDYLPRHGSDSLEDLHEFRSNQPPYPEDPIVKPYARSPFSRSEESVETAKATQPPPVPQHMPPPKPPDSPASEKPTLLPSSLAQAGKAPQMSYMKEYPNHPPAKPKKPPPIPTKQPSDRESDSDRPTRGAPPRTMQARASPVVPRKAVGGRAAGVVSAIAERQKLDNAQAQLSDRVRSDTTTKQSDLTNSSPEPVPRKVPSKSKAKATAARAMTPPTTDESPDSDASPTASEVSDWDKRVKQLMKHLPKGVDEAAAKQIFNEIVIKGDEVHWDDVAGLEIAKSALKETVVYPFLRPDLFMGLREPARGMLLFGPPGTGKTMLARAVATESRSVFFAISASSLTSKYLGESEKLVRALFAIAKALAPSIIFVDEIDSLLGARGGSSEHEATRRIKTEFLINWSDLQKAAAGREEKDKEKGDASRVLVLAATNLPWAIDEAARRRFVRRQYIPLPEDWVREKQLRTLLSAQKHGLKDRELKQLVRLTDGKLVNSFHVL